jgi:hypothetical protein
MIFELTFTVVIQESPHSGWSMDVLVLELYDCTISLRFGVCNPNSSEGSRDRRLIAP